MKFTLSWLRDHLDTDASLEEITDRLTMLGLEVEEVVDRSAEFAAFKSALVVEAKPHLGEQIVLLAARELLGLT